MGIAGDADSSDDDIDIVPKSVDNYWLEHGNETPVSFASLPYFKTGEENLPNKLVYVRGTQDNGMRLYMRAVAWKLEFTQDIKPVFHLKTEKYWIELKKPRKSFETTIRSIMSTAVFLNYALFNPGDPEKVAWNHVKDVYKSWDVAPRRDDLASHLLVIQHLIESNERLASSFALQAIPTGVPRKRLAMAREVAQQSSALHQYKYEEEHLDHEEELDTYGDDLDLVEVGDLAETVCCICDDGGDMICCDGPCMRSFHFKGASGSCSTLGLSKIDADRMDKFFCPNCKFKRHQCYACGELGCSDDGSGADCEVFLCGVSMCGHFYHPSCVAKLVLRDKDTSEQVAMAKSIEERKAFACPMHNCWKCGQVEVKEARNLQFGICRRCPRVWHRQCLSSSLLHDDPKRCWYGLLPNRILVYCKQHTVIPELATPARNHVKFPEDPVPTVRKRMIKRKAEEEEKKSEPSQLGSLKLKAATNLKSPGVLKAAKKTKPFSPLKQMKPKGREPTKSKLYQGGVAPRSSMAKARDRLRAVNLVKDGTNVGFSAVKQKVSSQENEQKCNSPSKGSRSNLDAKLARTSVVAGKSHPLPQRNKALVYKASSVDKETKSMVDDIIGRAKASVTIESVLMKHDVPGSPWKASSPQPPSNSDFDAGKNGKDKAAVELGGEDEMCDLGKRKYDRSLGEVMIVNGSIGGGDTIGDLDKRLSSTLQGEHMIMNEPTSGQGTVSNLDSSNVSKLDQNMRRRELLECDDRTFDTQVNDNSNSSKSYKVKTITKYSNNDGFVPLKRHTNMKRMGVDSSIEELSGSQFNQYSSQESPEKARNSSRHGVSMTERKTNSKYICSDEKKNDELAHDNHQHKITTGKHLDNKEADLDGRKSPDRQDMYEPGRRKLPDKYGINKLGEERKASPERSRSSCMANEGWIKLPDTARPNPVEDLGKLVVSKNDDHVNFEPPKSALRPDSVAQYEFVNRNFHVQEALRAQRDQRQVPFIGCNAQMPGRYNGAAFATLNRHSGLHSSYPPIGMQVNYTSNRYGTEHPVGSSGAGGYQFLPEFQRSRQYIGPSTIIPPNPAPFYPPSGPVHLPPGYGSFQPNYYAPLGFQRNFLPVQPQYPPIPERLPNQKNTGGWFDD